jgi:hypothetical protein
MLDKPGAKITWEIIWVVKPTPIFAIVGPKTDGS